VKRREETWTCPPEGMFKINVDAALSEDEGRSSVDVVIRWENKHWQLMCQFSDSDRNV
jgi:hypothetical protein